MVVTSWLFRRPAATVCQPRWIRVCMPVCVGCLCQRAARMMSFCAGEQQPSCQHNEAMIERGRTIQSIPCNTHTAPMFAACFGKRLCRPYTHYIVRVAGHSARLEPHIRCQSCTSLLMTCVTTVKHVRDSHNPIVSWRPH